MPESVQSGAEESSTTFASLLSSLTGSAPKSEVAWDLSDLADDVATISYEQALRTHRRVRVSEHEAASPTKQQTRKPERISPAECTATNEKKTRKTASITIRLTKAEETQLHERAAEAGLSISAYLRSCIFETESLRSQVKEALAQMRAASVADTQASRDERPSSAEHSRFRFFPGWSRRRNADA